MKEAVCDLHLVYISYSLTDSKDLPEQHFEKEQPRVSYLTILRLNYFICKMETMIPTKF